MIGDPTKLPLSRTAPGGPGRSAQPARTSGACVPQRRELFHALAARFAPPAPGPGPEDHLQFDLDDIASPRPRKHPRFAIASPPVRPQRRARQPAETETLFGDCRMKANTLHDEPPPAQMVAGALAHLACHMTTGCPRAAERAALLLERVAADPEADPHLRAHAHELVDVLERKQAAGPRRGVPASRGAA
jgi:hypothetical protein